MAERTKRDPRSDGEHGSYWIPVFNILEDHFTVVLANPEEVKTRKGHKTDRKDAEHLAELLRHNHVPESRNSTERNQTGAPVRALAASPTDPASLSAYSF